MTRMYGWKPSRPNPHDDLAFPKGVLDSVRVPERFSLREQLPAVLDQGNLGSCTANALAGLMQFLMMQEGKDFGVPSRLFIYYQERLREGTVHEDSGAFGRDGFAALRKVGVPPEEIWPYIEHKFTTKPSKLAYEAAADHKILRYTQARTQLAEVQHLILNKKPVAFGFTVFPGFEQEDCLQTGIVPMPARGEREIGGHEVYAFGWKPGYLECRNSWGPEVMDEGNFWLPFDYAFGGYASDWRAIRS